MSETNTTPLYKYLDNTGLSQVWSAIIANFVKQEQGKGLSANDLTDTLLEKLNGIAEGAQVNVIESVKVNNTVVDIVDKTVNITVPTGALASLDKVAEGNLDDALAALINGKADKATTLAGYGITDAYTKSEADTELGKKVDKEEGKGLSTNDYDNAAVAEVAKVANKADKATSLAGYGITDAYTKSEVDAKVASVYKVKGTITFENLPTEGMVEGDTYNVTDAFTADETFVTAEQGKSYPAGTNVVYTENGWDALAGVYDFSDFVKKEDIAALTEAEIAAICVIE